MRIENISVRLLVLALLSSCASFNAGSDIQSGRLALLTGNGETALAYFQRAAQLDPNAAYGTALRQGIASYIGRAEYAAGRYQQAQQTLQKVVVANQDDGVARLFLGLSLARTGDRQRGLTDIESGMKGIDNFLEYVTQTFRFSFGQYWDPARQIRNQIQIDLAMIAGREFNWDKLIADGEWIGKEIEEEGDRARNDEARDRNRSNDGSGSIK